MKRIVGWTGESIDGERLGPIIRNFNMEKDATLLMNFSEENSETSFFILEIDDEHDRVRIININKNGIEVLDHVPKIETEGWMSVSNDVESEF